MPRSASYLLRDWPRKVQQEQHEQQEKHGLLEAGPVCATLDPVGTEGIDDPGPRTWFLKT